MKKIRLYTLSSMLLMLIICSPAATWLQSQKQWVAPEQQWDAIYLVCGARAQNNRIKALSQWLGQRSKDVALAVPSQKRATGENANSRQASHAQYVPRYARDIPLPLSGTGDLLPINPSPINHQPLILIGNDPQKSLWCRKHQTNHTVSAWAVEKLKTNFQQSALYSPPHTLSTLPGTFSNTDGEMQVLAIYLKSHPEIKSIALVTSRYHARRAQQRLQEHLSSDHDITIGIIPGIKHINNRNPITVIIEYLKITRDNLGLSDTPIISRSQTVDD